MILFEPVKTELWAAGQPSLSDCSASVCPHLLDGGQAKIGEGALVAIAQRPVCAQFARGSSLTGRRRGVADRHRVRRVTV